MKNMIETRDLMVELFPKYTVFVNTEVVSHIHDDERWDRIEFMITIIDGDVLAQESGETLEEAMDKVIEAMTGR